MAEAHAQPSTHRGVPWALVLLLLAAWGLLLFRASAPFYGAQDAFRVWVAAAARNYEAYGLDEIGLMMVRDPLPNLPHDERGYYSHHPPLLVWIPALARAIFGDHELALRFGFIAATLLSVAALYLLARRLAGHDVALLASACYSITPLIAYHGRVPGMAQLALPVGLLFGAVMANWLARPNRARLALLAALAVLAVWTAWSTVFFTASFSLAAFVLGGVRGRRLAVGLGMLTLLAFSALMLFYQAQWAGSIESLLDAFIWRTSSSSGREEAAASFSALGWLAQNLIHLLLFSSLGLLALAAWGLLIFWRNATRRRRGLLIALLLAPTLYILVFRNASYIHDYYKTFYVPGLAILASAALMHVPDPGKKNHKAKLALQRTLIGLLVIQSAVIFAALHLSGRQPRVDALIDWLNTAPGNAAVVIHASDDTFNGYEYGNVVIYYTGRSVTLNAAPQDHDGPLLHITCTDEPPAHGSRSPGTQAIPGAPGCTVSD